MRLVLSTCPPATASGLARKLVEERLAACVSILPGVRSIYRWKDEICDDGEVLCLIKTTVERYPALVERLLALHPYELPEILAFDSADGLAAYLGFIDDGTRPA